MLPSMEEFVWLGAVTPEDQQREFDELFMRGGKHCCCNDYIFETGEVVRQNLANN